MRRIVAPLLVLAALAGLAGCGAGPRTTETRHVAPYDRVEVDSSIDVEVVPGDGNTVTVAGGENVIDHVETASSDGVLHLSIRDHGIVIGPDPYDDVRVQVSRAVLQGVRIQGSSDVSLGRIEAPQLSIDIQGSGGVEASGRVGTLDASIHGSGDADLHELAARSATVSIEGSGDARVNVEEQLDVSVAGSGDVSYRGNPRVSQHVEGSGDVHADD
jgi:Putative auto-transporter adhesin, head GIN domain